MRSSCSSCGIADFDSRKFAVWPRPQVPVAAAAEKRWGRADLSGCFDIYERYRTCESPKVLANQLVFFHQQLWLVIHGFVGRLWQTPNGWFKPNRARDFPSQRKCFQVSCQWRQRKVREFEFYSMHPEWEFGIEVTKWSPLFCFDDWTSRGRHSVWEAPFKRSPFGEAYTTCNAKNKSFKDWKDHFRFSWTNTLPIKPAVHQWAFRFELLIVSHSRNYRTCKSKRSSWISIPFYSRSPCSCSWDWLLSSLLSGLKWSNDACRGLGKVIFNGTDCALQVRYGKVGRFLSMFCFIAWSTGISNDVLQTRMLRFEGDLLLLLAGRAWANWRGPSAGNGCQEDPHLMWSYWSCWRCFINHTTGYM